MGTVYGENGLTGTGYTHPKRVNFGWLGEAWSLFRENAALWIFAILIGVYGPIIFNLFIASAWGLTSHVAGLSGSLAQGIAHVPPGLRIGVGLLNVVYTAFIWSGIFRMAVKQVSGEPIFFADIFSGGRNFGSMLIFLIIADILVGVGSAIVLLPGILAATLLLPGFALVASGEPLGSALSRSASAMWKDRFTGMAFVFGLGAIILLSWLVFLLGPLVTLSMFALVSALAYRDMIGLPQSENLESIEAILGLNPETRPAVSLTGEPIEESSGPPPAQK